MVGQGLTAFAFVIVVLALLIETEPLASYLTSRHFHDFGKLLLAFVMLWAYLAFSQFLIIWAGNLPEEIPWYLQRIRGPWGYVALLLVVRPLRAAVRAAAVARPEEARGAAGARSRSASWSCG